MSCVHPTTPKLGAAAGGCIAGNQHERVWLAAPSPWGNKESISRLAVFQRRARLGSAQGFAGGGAGLGSVCAPSLVARRVWSVASCRQVHGIGCDLRLQASGGRGRAMVRRGGRCKEGAKSRENFLYGSLASAKQEKMPFQQSLFSALWAVSAEELLSPEGKGGSESPDFRRPGAADPGCPNPDPWSLRGSAQDGRCRVRWRHRDPGRGWGEEERGDLAALGRALSQCSW